MIANYHTHTFRCGHAKGEDRAYVETAIERGLPKPTWNCRSPLFLL